MKKRLLSLLLVLTMLVGLLPMAVFAAEETLPEIPEDIAKATELDVDDLTFALNFGFNLEGISEEKQAALFEAYQNYYIDFELAVNSKVTFNADSENADGYLAGSYGAYNSGAWVKVPVSDVTLDAGKSIRIMEYAAKAYNSNGLYQTLANIYEVVNSFNCGVFFTEEFLTANPDLVVTLKLNAYEPVEGADSPYGEAITLGTYTFTNPKKTVVVEIQNNTALDEEGYAPVEGVEGVEKLSVTLAIVELSGDGVAKITYSVEPLDANGNKVSAPSTAITFRLPIPASVTETHAKVYHEGEYMGTYPIVGEGNGKYVEVTSANFSEFAVEPTNVETEENVAKIGTQGYKTLAEAFAAAKNGDTIVLLSDLAIDTETYTIADGVSVNLDMNGKKLTVTDNATANYELFYIYGGMTVYGNGTIELTSTNDRDWNAMSAIFHNRGGVLTIENGTFRNLGGTDMAWVVDNSGNWFGDATTNINGGTLTSTYTAIRNRMEQNSHGASGTAYLNVSGGSINGTTSAIWAQAASTSTTSPATGEINISGGNIGLVNTARSTGAKCMTTISGGTVAGVKCEVGELTVTGEGKITGNITILTATGDETDYAVDANGQYVTAAAAIGTKGFVSLQAAFAAAQTGDTITLLADVELSETIKATGKVTLDLNSKTITGTDNATVSFALIEVQPGAELTIKGNGKITLTATNNRAWNAYSSVISNQRGKFILESGTLEHLGGTDMAYGIDNLTNGKGTYAETVINGGTVKSTYRGIRQFLNGVEAQNILTVNGGTIEGANRSIWMQDPSKNANSGTLTVGEDASLKGDVYLYVTPGSTEWPVSVSIAAAALAESSTVVTGNIPEGYVVEETNGTWGNRTVSYVAQIGEDKYESLQAAIEAAKTGETVTLVKDIELEKTTPVLLDGSYNTYFLVEGKSVTIDLNGKTISGAYAGDKMLVGVFSTDNNGHLTLTGNGTVDVTATGKVYSLFSNYNPGCSITIENGTYKLDKASDCLIHTAASANEGNGNEGVVIKGGSFHLGNVGTSTNGSPWIINANGKGERHAWVTGGTYNANVFDQYWRHEVQCGGLYAAKDNGDDTWTVVPAEAYIAVDENGYDYYVGYATLAEAVKAVKADETVTLAKDIEVEKSIAITGNRNVTIDLNGHTLSSAKVHVITCYYSNTTITIKDSVGGGKVLTTGSGKHAFVVQSNLVIDGAEISSDKGGNAIVAQKANANVTIQNNSVINGKIVVKEGKLTIENGTFKNKLEISDGVTVSIAGGTYVQEIPDEWCIDYYGSVDNGDGTWTVKFVKFVLNKTTGKAYRTVAEAIAAIGKDAGTQNLKLLGDVTVKGQFIGHSYAQKVVIDLNGHKMSSTDKALTVYRSGTEVTIKNGTVHGNSSGGTIQVTYGGKLILGENVTITSGGSANALKVDDNSTLIIAEDSAKVLGGLASRGRYDITASTKAIIKISAGNFSQPVKAEWCAEGYMPDPFQHEDGTYGVMKWKAAMIDGVFYNTLQEAIEAAKDGETVTVLSNLELDWDDVVTTAESGYAVLLCVEGKSITLDLNGKTISVDHQSTTDRIYAVVYVADGASLTVTGNGSIDVTANATTPRVAYMFWKRGTTGSLTIENGSFHMNDSEDSMVYTNGNEIVTVEGGTFILDSVDTRVNGSPWIFNVKGAGDHHVIVAGGTFNFNIQRQHWANEVMVPGTHYVEKDNEDNIWNVNSGAALYVNEGILTGPFYISTWEIGYASLDAFFAAADANLADTIDRYDPVTLLKDLVISDDITLVLAENGQNGKAITLTGDGSLTVANGTQVTVTAAEGDVVVTYNEDGTTTYSIGENTIFDGGVI